MATVVVMPQLGNSVESCLIVSWQVKVGDEIAENAIVCEVETDKASMEVPTTAGGTVLAILWDEGDDVPVKEPLLVVGAAGEDPAPARAGLHLPAHRLPFGVRHAAQPAVGHDLDGVVGQQQVEQHAVVAHHLVEHPEVPAENLPHRQQEHNHHCGHQIGYGNAEHFLPAVRPVDLRGLVHLLVDTGYGA